MTSGNEMNKSTIRMMTSSIQPPDRALTTPSNTPTVTDRARLLAAIETEKRPP